MPRKVRFRQLAAHGEALDPDDDAGRFLRDVVLPAPGVRVEDAGAPGAEYDANEGGEGGFGQVEAVADEVREEGVEDQEGGEDEVG